MKKVLSLVLALLMAVSTASMAFAAETTEPAITEEAPKLISAATTYAEAIGMLDAYGIMKGVDPNTFNADADSDIQRYQMALFIGRIVTGWTNDAHWTDGPVNNSEFNDLAGTPAENYYGAISFVNQKGIIEGYGNGKFGPTDGITYRDALTMAVRALGYGGQKYPWGYIEKAETLGLTKGITGVAYTDVLNRGEVAQIIYNALFITTSVGDTLAARNFGENLGMMKVMVTATPRALLDGKDAADTKLAPAGTVGFKVINDDGTLGDTTYYVDYKQLGITSAHESYESLGRAFSALFTVKGDNIVEILGHKNDLYVDTVWNNGWKSADKDGKYPIEAYLAANKLTLRDKYSKSTYIVKYDTKYAGEIIIRDTVGEKSGKIAGNDKFAIDWNTGDILVKDAKGTIDVDGDKYAPLYYYNALLDKYFEVKTVKVNGSTVSGDVKIVGIDLIDDIVAKLGKYTADTTSTKGGYLTLTKADKFDTAYASLELYDLNGDKAADWGLFTEYAFGQYKAGKETCDKGEGDKAAHVIVSKNGDAAKAWAIAAQDIDKTEADYADYAPVSRVKEGGCDHGTAYIQDGVTLKDGDYVLYAYNPSADAILVKTVIDTDKTDGTYVATGLLRAYNVADRSVTIGEDTLKFDYNNLAGNAMKLTSDFAWAKAVYSAYLNKYFMNFVKYVVVDDKIVCIEGTVNDAPYIIVDSYAGISADGYVVVNGYKSNELKYTQIRIGAYDQWLKGDIYNYAHQYIDSMNAPALFTKGAIYKATSYDKANDAYYVQSVAFGTPDAQGYLTYDIAGLDEYVIDYNADGYRYVGKKPVGDYSRAKAEDKYVFILENPNNDYGYAPIVVYTGKGGANWHAEGYKIADNIYVNATLGKGFDSLNKYAVSYGLVISKNYDSASYIPAATATGTQLLGSSKFTANVVDLITGEVKLVTVVNKDVKVGYAYSVINSYITDATPYGASDLEITGYDGTAKVLKTAFPKWSIWQKALTKSDWGKEKISKIISNYKDNLDGGVTYYAVTVNGEKVELELLNEKAYKALFASDTVELDAVITLPVAMGNDNSTAVVYVLGTGVDTAANGNVTSTTDKVLVSAKDPDAYVDATLSFAITEAADGTLTGKVNSIKLWFAGEGIEDTHQAVYNDKNFFGLKDGDSCVYEDWKTEVKVNTGDAVKVRNSIASKTFHNADLNYVSEVVINSKDGIGTLKCDGTDTITVTFSCANLKDDGTVEYKQTNIVFNVTDVKAVASTDKGISSTSYKVTTDFASGTVNGEAGTPTARPVA
jgi:hypothetical protein